MLREIKGGAVARGDLELLLMTLVFNNRCAVISSSVLCNRLSEEQVGLADVGRNTQQGVDEAAMC